MRVLYKIILLIYISNCLLANQIDDNINRLFSFTNSKQSIRIKDTIYRIDLQHLIEMTAQIESRYGQDKYKGRVALSPFQYEPTTAKYYISVVPELREYIESNLGRKLRIDRDEDSVYITYLVYMSKLRYHKQWLDKYYKLGNGDVEWLVYKVLWNSIKGASTYTKWKQRKVEKEVDKLTRI